MSVLDVPPRGTRGVKVPRLPGALNRLVNGAMYRIFRNRPFMGAPYLLELSTIGARSGQPRRSTVSAFPEGESAWLIVASAGGSATHPAWFFNLANHPDQVWVEVGARKLKVKPELLKGDARAAAWQKVITQAPSFAGYESKTDREIPVIRLTPV